MTVSTSRPSLRLWKALVTLFVIGWFLLVFGFGYWPLVREHWGIAVVMIFGSLVAGSTPMGGGSVAFPILVYGFGESPENARNFGLAIQALGMTSALLFILGRGTRIQRRLLVCGFAAGAAGIVFGTYCVMPHVSRAIVKLLFACMWMSFAVVTLWRNREFCALQGGPDLEWSDALRVGLPVGLVGGIIASMIGVGLEMVLYAVMVPLFRCDLKIAIPTAVCSTALASLVGTALHIWIGDIPRAVFGHWLACAPLVIFGAPAGTYLVTRFSRLKLLYFVSGLCVFQFLWTLYATSMHALEWGFAVTSLAVGVAGFVLLDRRGKRLDMERSATPVVRFY